MKGLKVKKAKNIFGCNLVSVGLELQTASSPHSKVNVIIITVLHVRAGNDTATK